MASVIIPILTETRDALKQVDNFTKQTEKQTRTIANGFKALGVVAAGAVAVFASRKVVNAISNQIKAANQYEDNLSQLNNSLRLAGTFSEQASRDFEQFASTIQRTTRFGDDAALKTLELATNFGLSGDRAKQFTEAAAELAQVTGQSLEGAARQLSQTLTGQAGTLARNVAGVRELTAEQLKSGAAIDLLIDRFGGTALAATKTFAGAQDQLAKAQGDVTKQLGFLITQNPIIIKAIDLLAKGFAKLSDFIEDNRDRFIELTNRGLLAVLRQVPRFIRVIGGISKVFNTIFKAQSAFIVSWLKGWRMILDIKVIRSGLELYQQAFTFLFSSILDGIATLLSGFSKIPGASRVFEALGFSIEDATLSLFQLSSQIQSVPDGAFADGLTSGLDMMIETAESARETTTSLFDGFADGADKIANFADEAVKSLENLDKTAQKTFDTPGGIVIEATGDPTSPDFVGPPKPADTKTVAKIFGKEIDVDASLKKFGGELLRGLQRGGDGAVDFVSALGGAAADFFLPGIGSMVSEFIQFATQDPEVIREQINAFVDALPEVIDAFVEGVPVIVEALVERADDIAVALTEAVVIKLPIALTRAAVEGARVFIENVIREVGKAFEFLSRFGKNFEEGFGRFISALSGLANIFKDIGRLFSDLGRVFQQLIDAIAGVGKSLDPTRREGVVGQIVRGDVKGLGKRLGFAKGLTEVPQGFPRDSFPANLTSGERVVDADTNRDLKDFLSQARSGGGSQQVVVVLQVGQEELARTIVELDRSGFQLRA